MVVFFFNIIIIILFFFSYLTTALFPRFSLRYSGSSRGSKPNKSRDLKLEEERHEIPRISSLEGPFWGFFLALFPLSEAEIAQNLPQNPGNSSLGNAGLETSDDLKAKAGVGFVFIINFFWVFFSAKLLIRKAAKNL